MLKMTRDHPEVGMRLRLTHSLLQPADSEEPVGLSICQKIQVVSDRGGHRHGRPKIRLDPYQNAMESGGGYTDCGEVRAVNVEGLSQDPGVSAEPLLPEPMAEYDGRIRSVNVFLWQECTANGGLNAKHIEEIAGNQSALSPFALACSTPARQPGISVKGSQPGEHLVVVSVIHVIRVSQGDVVL